MDVIGAIQNRRTGAPLNEDTADQQGRCYAYYNMHHGWMEAINEAIDEGLQCIVK